jgi:hypothetical protein
MPSGVAIVGAGGVEDQRCRPRSGSVAGERSGTRGVANKGGGADVTGCSDAGNGACATEDPCGIGVALALAPMFSSTSTPNPSVSRCERSPAPSWKIRSIFKAITCGERCDGTDNDGDGVTDEGFIGTGSDCAAASCWAISDEASAFASRGYYLTSARGALTTCAF